MADEEDFGIPSRDIPAGTILGPSGTLIGVADTRGDVLPPDLAEDIAPDALDESGLGLPTADELAGGPTSLSDAEAEAAGLTDGGAVDYRRLGEAEAEADRSR